MESKFSHVSLQTPDIERFKGYLFDELVDDIALLVYTLLTVDANKADEVAKIQGIFLGYRNILKKIGFEPEDVKERFLDFCKSTAKKQC